MRILLDECMNMIEEITPESSMACFGARVLVAEVDADLLPALTRIERDIHQRVSVERIATDCGMTYWEFSRRFEKALGMCFYDYLEWVRIKKARQLLSAGESNLERISAQVGFCEVVRFISVFTRITGVSPATYRCANDKAG